MIELSTIAAATALLAPAVQDQALAARVREPSMEVTLLTGAWLTRLDGKASLGAGAPQIELAQQFNLDDQEAALDIELAIRRHGIWTLTLSGFDFSTGAAGTFPGAATFGSLVFAGGEPFSASMDLTSVALDLGIASWRPLAEGTRRGDAMINRTAANRYIADLRFSPQLGLRWADADQRVTAPGGTETAGGEWAFPYAGFDLTLDFRPENPMPMLDSMRLQAAFAFGPALGGDGGYMWQVRAGLTMQVTNLFGVMVGYRALELNVENDDYDLEGGLQGLFLAASLRF